MFGVASSNLSKVFLFGIPEGDWTNGKMANEVLSMVHVTIHYHTVSTSPSRNLETLLFHSVNCSGQNKNRFVLWYLSSQAIFNNRLVNLRFLIPGHTTYLCDDAFGLIKKQLTTRDVNFSTEMMQTLEHSYATSSVIDMGSHTWKDCNSILNTHFVVSAKLIINP